MRTTPIKLTKVKINGQRFYCVTFPQLPSGRGRRHFKSKPEAETFLELKKVEKENFGTAAMSLTDRARAEYVECSELLKPFGVTLRDAVSFYLPHLKARHQSCKIADLVQRLLKTKALEGRSARYLKDLRLRLTAFAESFPTLLVAEITHADVEGWLQGLELSPISRNNYRRVLVVLFNFAQTHNLCATNPAESVGQAKVLDQPPGILTPEQAADLLTASPSELVPYLAIGLFAGLRRAELERLDWREVKIAQGFIEVTAQKSKTARRRLVHIEPNVAEWLQPHAKSAGPVWPTNFESHFERAREGAGIVNWPDNALRHSFASYHLAQHCDAPRTALELGHTTTHLLFAHYRELCTKEDASKFWSIRPGIPANVVQLAA